MKLKTFRVTKNETPKMVKISSSTNKLSQKISEHVHKKPRYVVTDLNSKALRPTHVRNNPLIQTDCAIQIGRGTLAGSPPPQNPPEATADL